MGNEFIRDDYFRMKPVMNLNGMYYMNYEFFESVMSLEELSMSEKVTLIKITRHLNDPNAPFQQEIGESVGVSRKSAQNAIAKLESMGLIKRTTSKRGHCYYEKGELFDHLFKID